MEKSKSERKLGKTVIIKLGELAERTDALQEIGRRLVRQAVQNAVEERLGQKLSTPMVVRKVNKGEIVPTDLIGASDLMITSEGLAVSGWEKTWLNLAIWTRSWCENEARFSYPPLGLLDPKVKFRLQTILEPKEIEIIESLKIIE